MNKVRAIRCGQTTLTMGQLFDPNRLVDPAALSNPLEKITHLFDRLGMLAASNDDAVDMRHAQKAPDDQHRA